MNEEQLTELVYAGKSIQDLANHYGKSKTSIRHWLTKYNLTTTGKAGNKPVKLIDNKKMCGSCNELFPLSSFGQRKDRGNKPRTYCLCCESNNTMAEEYKIKDAAIGYCGGKCIVCDLQGDRRIFDFHHFHPEHKDFNISHHKSRSFQTMIKELDKCWLVCTNCHQEIHSEMKKRAGYTNKIVGNTELAALNKQRKIDFIGESKCSMCGYDSYIGSLVIKFKQEDAHLRKYNKTHWDKDFENALSKAKVICKNCNRKYTEDDEL